MNDLDEKYISDVKVNLAATFRNLAQCGINENSINLAIHGQKVAANGIGV